MGYPQYIDDVPTSKLKEEIERRQFLLEQGKCPYCNCPLEAHTCKYSGKSIKDSPNLYQISDYHADQRSLGDRYEEVGIGGAGREMLYRKV